ncbi:MAG: glycosyl transferase [Confluentimicrobium sp.]|jgi:GT2 family glycosyltransferase|uniref:glycosyltransferase family 2 protein n=1 Tax=Actibacterium sp. TaxID=1872125 RepID=UPI000C5B33B9|nr:glycosyltransferase [Actibacterium sp.]MBC57022.1 glycosyl transferase [Actibacterium sp.]
MSDGLRVSVVVVSHQRPEALSRCLTSLTQLDFAEFEVVVAADAPGLAAVRALGLGGAVKQMLVEAPGISGARNAGLSVAAGDVVAFIDDDAVAEPTWLTHLTGPFRDARVAAASGFVRGRNGISFQWKARTVDRLGRHMPLVVPQGAPSLHRGTPERAIKTEGTNMAFRRAALARIGGFDPAYRFFLDETDVNMRLALEGAVTAIVPLAQVHHSFAPSPRRAATRAPLSLFENGASTAVYLRKFAPELDRAAGFARLRADERRRVVRQIVRGNLGPRDLRRLMDDLEAGLADGLSRPIRARAPLPPATEPFRPFPGMPGRGHLLLAGRPWQARRLRRSAETLVYGGQPVTLFLFSPTSFFHRMRFRQPGYWEQTGGLFGRSDRGQRLFRITGFHARVQREKARLSHVRSFEATIRNNSPLARGDATNSGN